MWGITLDKIVRLDVVLANGTVTIATPTLNPELFWVSLRRNPQQVPSRWMIMSGKLKLTNYVAMAGPKRRRFVIWYRDHVPFPNLSCSSFWNPVPSYTTEQRDCNASQKGECPSCYTKIRADCSKRGRIAAISGVPGNWPKAVGG